MAGSRDVALEWIGPPPPAAFAAALGLAGISVRRNGGGPCAVASAVARRPRPPSGRPWVWVTPKAPGEAAASQAVLDGAYDVVALDARDAAMRLAARVRE